MSWIPTIWPMFASAYLSLALVHMMVWWKRREVWANLLFSLSTVAIVVFAAFELWMMRAETSETGMDGLWAADIRADPQLCLQSKSQLSGDHCLAPRLFVRGTSQRG